MTIAPVEAIGALVPPDLTATATTLPTRPPAVSFEQMLTNGIEAVDQKVQAADAMVAALAADEPVPLHQVMYSLHQANLSFQLMVQVRSRLVEGYQELMRMQL